jgi:uncharacterized protein with HEPN domain
LADTQCQDAVIRRIEIIGEAARRVSEDSREAHPQLPWQAMVGMRNVMIHDYDDIDLGVVWETLQNDLSPLVKQLEEVRRW